MFSEERRKTEFVFRLLACLLVSVTVCVREREREREKRDTTTEREMYGEC